MTIPRKDKKLAAVSGERKQSRLNCVSDKTHKLICKHNLTTSNKRDPIIDRIPLDDQCYEKIKHDYNLAANGGFKYGFEAYLDSYVETQIEIISKKNCKHTMMEAAKDESPTILKDLKALYREKDYVPIFRNPVQALEYLKHQSSEVKHTANEIIIKFSNDRDFLLPEEMAAIRVLAEEFGTVEICNFKDHVIRMELKGVENNK